jgi:hypothetical protein
LQQSSIHIGARMNGSDDDPTRLHALMHCQANSASDCKTDERLTENYRLAAVATDASRSKRGVSDLIYFTFGEGVGQRCVHADRPELAVAL